MRRRCTSFLIAALLAAATWACDQAAPTSPTPQAVVGVDGLAASAATATGSQGAAGAVILGMKAPCEEGDTRPQCKDKGDDDVTLEATITFGGLTATTKQKTYSADESDIHVELMSEFDISLVININDLLMCFTDYAEGGHHPWFHVFGSASGPAAIAVRFGASKDGGKKVEGYSLDLNGDFGTPWFPTTEQPATATGTTWSVSKVQGKGAGEECASSATTSTPVNWTVTVTRVQ